MLTLSNQVNISICDFMQLCSIGTNTPFVTFMPDFRIRIKVVPPTVITWQSLGRPGGRYGEDLSDARRAAVEPLRDRGN